MLCDICSGVLRDHAGRRKNILHEHRFDHHLGNQTLLTSLEQGCSICSVLARQLERNGVDLGDGGDISLQASLSVTWGRQIKRRYYSLDFRLRNNVLRTFVLQPKGEFSRICSEKEGCSHTHLPTDRKRPKRPTLSSIHTCSKQVFKLAEKWISGCNCASPKQEWYPDRLLDLREVKNAVHSKHRDVSKKRVYLLQNSEEWKIKESARPENNRFVTLSHRWGLKGVPLALVAHNMKEMMTRGIALGSMPKTFQDAIVLASHLKDVQYVWIDSLCIVQKSKDDGGLHAEDWQVQSALMDKVYHESYLNISATTSPDSSGGLFQKRDIVALNEEKVNLNVSGLADFENPKTEKEENAHAGAMKNSIRRALSCFRRVRRSGGLRKCTLVDVSLWDDLVELSMVNTRGWVYQERLLAPRILHFCDGQIAWECSERNCTERYPEGIPYSQLKSGEIVEGNLLKSFEPEREGRMLREARLSKIEDPDRDLPRLYTYELWRRIVEVYSQKDLTVPGDKLIALSGIARYFFDTRLNLDLQFPRSLHPYIAGMWSEHLESQLLWRVEPVFDNGRFFNQSKRREGRAPSFSWAALDVPQGVRYGDFTDQDLLFNVKSVDLKYVDKDNIFGLLCGSDCKLLLEAGLIEVALQRLDQEVAGVPYGWQFVDHEESDSPCYKDVHINVYLDSPDSDSDIFEPGARIFCMPAARGERTSKPSERYLVCLLLQLQEKEECLRSFKRVGLTKLSLYEEDGSRKALASVKPEDIYLY